jgi:hypothetical protein
MAAGAAVVVAASAAAATVVADGAASSPSSEPQAPAISARLSSKVNILVKRFMLSFPSFRLVPVELLLGP